MVETREDAFLNGRLRLSQPQSGYRAGMDALLLAAAIEAEPGQLLLEAGCGAGAALLAAATRLDQTRFWGIEKAPCMAELARANVSRNALEARVAIIEGDCLRHPAIPLADPISAHMPEITVFDGVFCNPPFDDAKHGPAPSPAREHAYRTHAAIEDWIKALANRLRGGAALTLIHRAHRLPEIMRALEGRLGGIEVCPVRPRAAEAAKRVLVRARKGSRAALRLYAGLDLHDDSGNKHSARAQALWQGGALDWR